jgi:hypothetical protein
LKILVKNIPWCPRADAVAQQAVDQVDIEGLREGEILNFRKGPSRHLADQPIPSSWAAQSRFNRKLLFLKINPTVVVPFAPTCSMVRQKGSMAVPFERRRHRKSKTR